MKIVNIIKKLFEIKSNKDINTQFKIPNFNTKDKKIEINNENSISLIKNKELIADECYYNDVLSKLENVMSLKQSGSVSNIYFRIL